MRRRIVAGARHWVILCQNGATPPLISSKYVVDPKAALTKNVFHYLPDLVSKIKIKNIGPRGPRRGPMGPPTVRPPVAQGPWPWPPAVRPWPWAQAQGPGFNNVPITDDVLNA